MTREEIIELKEKRGYSVAQLSQYSGVPEGTIRKIITGESKNPRVATLNALEKVLIGDETVFTGKSYKYDSQASVSFVCEGEAEYNAGSSALNHMQGQQSTVSKVKKQGEYTVEDYMALPDGDRKELIDGVFYDMATPTNIHQEIVGYMFFEIKSFINANKGKCRAVLAPSAVQLDCDNKTMVEPDIYIVCNPDKIKKFGNYGAPDFVLEVLSDSTRNKDLKIKSFKYMNAGVREIWYIDLKTRTLITYYEGDDYLPAVHPLEGTLGLTIYDGRLVINLAELGDIIEEYSRLTDPE
ncbi:MAG: Uma2 family endonuclease [Lachnospiraceae bacterium]|nr:Uma2 family endonuclease [Lachnospiraceae bacterium]